MIVLGVTAIQASALVATIGLGGAVTAWYVFGDREPEGPVVDVLGYNSKTGEPDVRTLEVESGAVRWLHREGETGEEDQAVRIVLDETKRMPSPFADRGFYLAEVHHGLVFEPVIDQDEIHALPIDGKRLEEHQAMQEAEHWAAAKQSDLMQLAKYAPWAFGVIILMLIVVLYTMMGP